MLKVSAYLAFNSDCLSKLKLTICAIECSDKCILQQDPDIVTGSGHCAKLDSKKQQQATRNDIDMI